MAEPSEADITINGVILSNAESMALRVAVTQFNSFLSDPNCLGEDELGKDIAKGYKNNIGKVIRLIMMRK